jgi:hypothetical protein
MFTVEGVKVFLNHRVFLRPTMHRVPENNTVTIWNRQGYRLFLLTFRARDNRTALVRLLLDGAVLPDAFCEGTHSQITHQHPIVTGAVEAWLVGDDAIAFLVMLEVVITAFHVCGKSK